MPYSLDELGHPIFLISSMAMHTQNLKTDPRASLLVTLPNAEGDPLGASRVTLMGNVFTVADARALSGALPKQQILGRLRRCFLLPDGGLGGFGVMGWVAPSEYGAAQPDPLADAMAGIIEHMNADHKDSLILLARRFAGIESEVAAMTSVDRLGFQVRLRTTEGMRGARIAFLREVSSPADTRNVLVEMVEQAWQH
jgi:hypothetical protein